MLKELLTTIWFNGAFFGGLLLWTVLYVPFAVIIGAWRFLTQKMPLHICVQNGVRDYGYVCCKLLSALAPVVFERRTDPLPSPCVIVSNHQSFFDAYCMGAFRPYGPVFFVRAWPFRIPFYRWVMLGARFLNTETLDKETFFKKAMEAARDGSSLLVFPEGTRSLTGRMGRFHSGGFQLAVMLGLPVVPLCIDGLGRIFPKGRRFGRPGAARVTLLPPVDSRDFLPCGDLAHLHLQRHVKMVIENELDNPRIMAIRSKS